MPRRDKPKQWTEGENRHLAQLWAEGVLITEIARVLQCSTSTTQRHVRMLRLPTRPNPIRPACAEVRRKAKPLKPGASTLPPLPSELKERAMSDTPQPEPEPLEPVPPVPAPDPAPPPPEPPEDMPQASVAGMVHIIGPGEMVIDGRAE